MQDAARTVVVGAGLAGSAVAMHPRSSSQPDAGGVRATWWRPVNVESCAATIDEFARHAGALAFRPRGHLRLHGPERWDDARAHVDGLGGADEMHSFSGRGVMPSWAAGLSLAEIITTGAPRTFPAAAALSGGRFAGRGPHQPEELHT